MPSDDSPGDRTPPAAAAWLRRRGYVGRHRLRRAAPVVALLAVIGAAPVLLHHSSNTPARQSLGIVCETFRGCNRHGYNSYGYASHQWRSYWRMGSGDDCTNYVAYVESKVYHARAPGVLLGNAGSWAATAHAAGIVVNHWPSVGAVAQWDYGTPGIGAGHVAVVEEVGPHRKYIVVSQDNMGGPPDYDWMKIKPGPGVTQYEPWPSNFIHFKLPQRADIGYFGPSTDVIRLRDSQAGGPANATHYLGAGRVIPLVGDWRGDHSDGLGYYVPRTGAFHLLKAHRSGRKVSNLIFRFGPPGMIPLVGDWTGIGRDGIGYYNPKTGTFYLRMSLTTGPPDKSFRFGPPGMVPLAGDWKGGAKDGIGFYNPRTGVFHLRNLLSTGAAYRTFRFGPAHMRPIVGNWAGGRKDGVGYYNRWKGKFYLRVRLSNGRATVTARLGPRYMIPVIGDWFGRWLT
jgi:surface antigen